ncbi:MAG: hypothetical protein LBS63_00945 [Prevotellaceae bacterium]|jgi:hypothetical protein|nr:hypothetical protein [Prevotellaceae bacterium]
MKAKNTLLVLAAGITLSSCALTKATMPQMAVRELGIAQQPLVGELDVKPAKIQGVATGRTGWFSSKTEQSVRETAVANALLEDGADILVAPSFVVNTTGGLWWKTTTVKALGHPASYKKIRPLTGDDFVLLRAKALLPTMTDAEIFKLPSKMLYSLLLSEDQLYQVLKMEAEAGQRKGGKLNIFESVLSGKGKKDASSK